MERTLIVGENVLSTYSLHHPPELPTVLMLMLIDWLATVALVANIGCDYSDFEITTSLSLSLSL